jgi:hypothetical protein
MDYLNTKEKKLVNFIVKETSLLANLDEINTNTILTAGNLANVNTDSISTVKVRVALMQVKKELLGGK